MSFRTIASLTAIIACALLLLGGPALAGVSWQAGVAITPEEKPLDVAYSLDGSRIYILVEGGKVLIYDEQGELTGTIPVDPEMDRISAVGLQRAGIPEKIVVTGSASGVVQELSLRFALQINTEGAPFLGRADAPVEIVEFSDFQCPHCARVKPLIEQIMLQFPDQVKVVFKHFPLSFHEYAKPAALATMAAQNQGKFWEFHDKLFAAQSEISPQRIRAIARELELDMERFNRDLQSRELHSRLEQDIQDGQQAGVRGTPTIFVNGMLLEQRSPENLRQMVEEALAR
ncbi:thioredoxin domain-containing protein [Desulfurivibrio alkaliphilus]|uniref:DSBA oxidoreductase n=1 Tax=Desulfurivibrio alkaliphilus (strain DSM 19089 / UNIQEM U267 / AHT2) TaxID=589865 RepID=D6Z004_DESAT|nr:thioredoxin domain-containing protein [Desulfurivibrio alkaliphilus]ADH85161.1 DSBA oxidoreductase [Desulfurivibrio alkaliphilus AHT 2]